MKIFKTFLIILLVSWLLSFSMIFESVVEVSEMIVQVFSPLGFVFIYLYFFSFWINPPVLFFVAPFSFPLLAFLNARKSGLKIWYGISIVSFLVLCFYFYPFVRTLLTTMKDIPDVPIIDFSSNM